MKNKVCQCEVDCRAFECLDCTACTLELNEYYMLTDEVWKKANPKDRGMLCIGCLELRLGRHLTNRDFADVPLNYVPLFEKSSRYQARFTSHG